MRQRISIFSPFTEYEKDTIHSKSPYPLGSEKDMWWRKGYETAKSGLSVKTMPMLNNATYEGAFKEGHAIGESDLAKEDKVYAQEIKEHKKSLTVEELSNTRYL